MNTEQLLKAYVCAGSLSGAPQAVKETPKESGDKRDAGKENPPEQEEEIK